jgi:1,4-alpha-glucan branching enzyme
MARKTSNQLQSFSITAPAATSILLVGDFTRWQEKAIPMKKQADGVWKVSVKLAPGTYHYRFVVDGQWCDDPGCNLRMPNPFGGENAVRQVA